ncbi:caspase family protein [Streptomyces sp. NRRL F-5650]|uniref:caspase family protein n=1 Tax=Streptomyces sp. NRRL F-5650 TaxID=1463868 RepID=UPI0006892AED|nr:caspase family protein [Streptomyces sp. NRRL F-5650]
MSRQVARVRGLWGLSEENCVVVSQPTRDTMLAAVDKAAAEATDTLVVYYAGHGLLYPLSSDLHLAVPETTKDKSYTAVKYEDLREILLSARRVRRKVVILDCCFSGTALRGALSADDAAAVRLAGVQGTSVLAASHATKQALAPPGEDYPAFTGELIALLDKGNREQPELLSMADIFDHVDQALLQKGRPRPQQLNRDHGAHICVARNRAPRPPEPISDESESRAEAEAARRRRKRKRWLGVFAALATLSFAAVAWFDPGGNAGKDDAGDSGKPTAQAGIECGRANFTFDTGDGAGRQEVSVKVVHDAACKGDFDAMEVAMDRGGFSGAGFNSVNPDKVIAEWKKRKNRTDFLQTLVTLLEREPEVSQGGLTFSNGSQVATWARGAGTQPDAQLRWTGYLDCSRAPDSSTEVCDYYG